MTAIFPFAFLRRGFREYLAFSTGVNEQGGGRRVTQKLHAGGELVARGSLLFPNPGGSWDDFLEFWAEDAEGGAQVFLYKAQDKGAAEATDAFVAASGQKDFELARRYVDVAKVVVKKNGVTQTLTTHYTLENGSGGAYVLGTSPKLVVHFGVAPGAAAAIDVASEFYFPVRFEQDELDEQDLHAAGRGAGDVADRVIAVRLREAGPGFSYVATPSAL